jgi:hypothetical protein|tara:strand:- start:1202 stop:2074 length:873 start_codon:yes stop_codon:yes gene_type:complete
MDNVISCNGLLHTCTDIAYYCTIEESEAGMPRYESNLTKDQQAELFRWLDEGKSAKEVARLVSKKFHPISERTIYNYKKRWSENIEARAKDELVAWDDVDRLVASGIYRDHLPILRYVSAWALSTFGQAFRTDPSYRILRWQSYVLYYTDSIERPVDIWVLGDRFAQREMLADYMDMPVERADIDAHLSFQPWESGEKEKRYLSAIEQGLVPSLPSFSDGDTLQGVHPKNIQAGPGRSIMAALIGSLIPEKRYLLPSQLLKELEKQWKSSPKIDIVVDGQVLHSICFSTF